MTKFKKIASYITLAGALSLSGVTVNAQMQGSDGMMNCPHMGQSGKMGMMNCHEMMKDCPMMDENVSVNVSNTENGMVVEWTGKDQASVEKIQKMGQHMLEMRDHMSGSENEN